MRALEAAVQLTGYGSALAVVNVAAEEAGPGTALEDARERVRRRQLTATYLQRVGEPSLELLAAARELEAELLVVGRRAESQGDAPGSVSQAVVRRAACDVLVVT